MLVDKLKGKVYDEERVTSWAVAIAEAVKQGIKGMCGCVLGRGEEDAETRWAGG